MSANEIADLMRQGMEAARAGDKTAAKAAFERVIELDENNEKAWFWLAAVLEDEAQKRVALNTVLHLNPGNTRARQALDSLDNISTISTEPVDEIIPGVPRRLFYLLVGGGGAIIIILLAVVLVVGIGNNRVQAELNATSTASSLLLTNVAAAQTQQALSVTQTAAAQVVLATPTRRNQLPPTFTPTAAATATPTPEPLPFPTGLTGRLAVWAGRDVDGRGFLPVGTISLVDGRFTPAGDSKGRDVSIAPDGERLVYSRFQPAVFTTLIESVNVNGTSPINLDEIWRGTLTLFEPSMPSYAPSGEQVVFVGREGTSTVNQVYVVTLQGLPPGGGVSPIRRISTDEATYSEPDLSPDGLRVVVVRNNINATDAGEDIVVIDIATGIVFPITNDRGAFIESSPSWSPDASQIVFAAAPSTEPNNRDIAVRFAAGSGQPILIARHPADDIYPVFSPDGRYIAFSSNRGRSGSYDIFVYDQQTQNLFQLTDTREDEFVGGWR